MWRKIQKFFYSGNSVQDISLFCRWVELWLTPYRSFHETTQSGYQVILKSPSTVNIYKILLGIVQDKISAFMLCVIISKHSQFYYKNLFWIKCWQAVFKKKKKKSHKPVSWQALHWSYRIQENFLLSKSRKGKKKKKKTTTKISILKNTIRKKT